jgi:hypothetical protein
MMTASDTIKLGGQNYSINQEYVFAGAGYNIDNHILLENLKDECIDGIGFSKKHPGYFFEFNKIDKINDYESRQTHHYILANIYILKIHKISQDFIIPPSILNKPIYIPNDIIIDYKIDNTTGLITDDKYKMCFSGIKSVGIYYQKNGWTIKLEKIS